MINLPQFLLTGVAMSEKRPHNIDAPVVPQKQRNVIVEGTCYVCGKSYVKQAEIMRVPDACERCEYGGLGARFTFYR